MTPFALYLLTAMASWMPAPLDNVQEELEQKVAQDIDVIVNDSEEPYLRGSKALTGLLLAGTSRLEGGFVLWVYDGRCNSQAWRNSREGKKMLAAFGNVCDGGHSYSLWQIQAEGGLALTPGKGYTSLIYQTEPGTVVFGIDLIVDDQLACRTALHIMRQSLHDWGNLTGYTGERGSAHPKADHRMNIAVRYLAAHPFTE